MEFTKLSSPSLKELFVHQLETMILSGRLPIGEKLPSERALCESMQVSRAVVNAGVADLAHKGFLTIKPRIGTFVADYRRNGTLETLISIMNYNGGIFREAEIRSILEIRIALDSLALELLIPKITQKDIQHLKEICLTLKEATSPHSAAESAFAFQHELAFISGNTLLPLFFSSFKSPIMTLWERFCVLHGIDQLHKNTAILCEHIESRNKDEAIAWSTKIIQDTLSGERQIYY